MIVTICTMLGTLAKVSDFMRAGGIILCGGLSSRMGLPKAALPFGPETMLARVYRLLSEVVQPIVVVAAADQLLPPLPEGTLITRDERPERGPLEGLLAGMRVMQPICELVYVTGCDVPLLQPAFVQRLLDLSDSYDAVATTDDEFAHPLAAVYQTRLIGNIEALLADDERRLSVLLREINTRCVPVEKMRDADPQLATLRNLNRFEDYLTALRETGFYLDASFYDCYPPFSSAEIEEAKRRSLAESGGRTTAEVIQGIKQRGAR